VKYDLPRRLARQRMLDRDGSAGENAPERVTRGRRDLYHLARNGPAPPGLEEASSTIDLRRKAGFHGLLAGARFDWVCYRAD
jgi:hypothetical protein